MRIQHHGATLNTDGPAASRLRDESPAARRPCQVAHPIPRRTGRHQGYPRGRVLASSTQLPQIV